MAGVSDLKVKACGNLKKNEENGGCNTMFLVKMWISEGLIQKFEIRNHTWNGGCSGKKVRIIIDSSVKTKAHF